MPLVRLFIFLAALFVIYMLWRRYKAHKQTQRQSKPPRAVENTVKCAYCGIYLPKSEAIQSDKGYYCSEKHQLADRR